MSCRLFQIVGSNFFDFDLGCFLYVFGCLRSFKLYVSCIFFDFLFVLCSCGLLRAVYLYFGSISVLTVVFGRSI